MERIQNFQDLGVWQKSHRLAIKIYSITKKLPKEERFGLVSQMRRAAVSVPANIAEGFIRRSKKEKINFYNISQGSLTELEYYLILVKDLRYFEDVSDLNDMSTEVGKMLNGLISSIESSFS